MTSTVKNSMYYTIGAIVKASASFVLLPLFANILGAEQYGIYNLLTTVSVIIGTLMTLAIERSLFRLYYDYTTEESKTSYLSTLFWTINAVSLMIMLLSIVCGKYIVHWIGDVDQWRVFMPMVCYTFLGSLNNFSQTLMVVEEQGAKFLKISMAILVIYNGMALLFLYFYAQTVDSLIYALFVANLVVIPLAYNNIRHRVRLIFSWTIMCNVLKYCMPLFLMIIFAWILNTTDRLFIGNMDNMVNAGIYSLASKFVQFSILFLGAIFQAYTPYFYKITNTMSYNDAVIKLRSVNNFISFFISTTVLVVTMLAQPILHLLFATEYNSCIYFIYLLSVSSLFTQQSGLLGPMIHQNKKTLGISVVTITAGCLSVLFNILLIPRYGSIAAGFSNLIVGLYMFISTFWLARRNYYIPLNIGIILYTLLCMAASFVLDVSTINLYIAVLIKIFLIFILAYICIRLHVVEKESYKFVFNKIIVSFKR